MTSSPSQIQYKTNEAEIMSLSFCNRIRFERISEEPQNSRCVLRIGHQALNRLCASPPAVENCPLIIYSV